MLASYPILARNGTSIAMVTVSTSQAVYHQIFHQNKKQTVLLVLKKTNERECYVAKFH